MKSLYSEVTKVLVRTDEGEVVVTAPRPVNFYDERVPQAPIFYEAKGGHIPITAKRSVHHSSVVAWGTEKGMKSFLESKKTSTLQSERSYDW